jgi:hypothetical protein
MAGETSKTFTIPILDDTATEASGDYFVFEDSPPVGDATAAALSNLPSMGNLTVTMGQLTSLSGGMGGLQQIGQSIQQMALAV